MTNTPRGPIYAAAPLPDLEDRDALDQAVEGLDRIINAEQDGHLNDPADELEALFQAVVAVRDSGALASDLEGCVWPVVSAEYVVDLSGDISTRGLNIFTHIGRDAYLTVCVGSSALEVLVAGGYTADVGVSPMHLVEGLIELLNEALRELRDQMLDWSMV